MVATPRSRALRIGIHQHHLQPGQRAHVGDAVPHGAGAHDSHSFDRHSVSSAGDGGAHSVPAAGPSPANVRARFGFAPRSGLPAPARRWRRARLPVRSLPRSPAPSPMRPTLRSTVRPPAPGRSREDPPGSRSPGSIPVCTPVAHHRSPVRRQTRPSRTPASAMFRNASRPYVGVGPVQQRKGRRGDREGRPAAPRSTQYSQGVSPQGDLLARGRGEQDQPGPDSRGDILDDWCRPPTRTASPPRPTAIARAGRTKATPRSVPQQQSPPRPLPRQPDRPRAASSRPSAARSRSPPPRPRARATPARPGLSGEPRRHEQQRRAEQRRDPRSHPAEPGWATDFAPFRKETARRSPGTLERSARWIPAGPPGEPVPCHDVHDGGLDQRARQERLHTRRRTPRAHPVRSPPTASRPRGEDHRRRRDEGRPPSARGLLRDRRSSPRAPPPPGRPTGSRRSGSAARAGRLRPSRRRVLRPDPVPGTGAARPRPRPARAEHPRGARRASAGSWEPA